MDSGGGAGTGVGMGGRERGRRLLSSGRGGSLVEHCWRCHIVATNCDQMNPKKRAASGRIQSIPLRNRRRSEEHTSELQSLMRISYAVFCLKKKKKKNATTEQITLT